MYEHRRHRPLSHSAFVRRVLWHLALVLALLLASLGIGMAGYMGFEGMGAVDAFVNAAMLLGGMGPVSPLATPAGKLFAGCYALYAGMVFIVTTALMLTPVAHRLLHQFHWDDPG